MPPQQTNKPKHLRLLLFGGARGRRRGPLRTVRLIGIRLVRPPRPPMTASLGRLCRAPFRRRSSDHHRAALFGVLDLCVLDGAHGRPSHHRNFCRWHIARAHRAAVEWHGREGCDGSATATCPTSRVAWRPNPRVFLRRQRATCGTPLRRDLHYAHVMAPQGHANPTRPRPRPRLLALRGLPGVGERGVAVGHRVDSGFASAERMDPMGVAVSPVGITLPSPRRGGARAGGGTRDRRTASDTRRRTAAPHRGKPSRMSCRKAR